MKQLLLALSLSFVAPSAMAQMVVIGDGAAKSCYQHALTGNMGSIGAIQTCDRALEKDQLLRKDEAATYVNRGVLLMRRGDHEAAEGDYIAALAIKPDLPEAHINHGVSLYHQARFDEALSAYDKAIKIGSEKDALAYYNRALVHERLDNPPAAYRDFETAAELAPDWEQPRDALSRFTVTKRTS
jgi:tetratricopeptide (TPR) repeat protein